MQHHEEPEVGNWYQDREYKRIFEIVALDNEDGEEHIQIQYYTGEIEELDLDTWYALDLRNVPEPEDWSAPFEIPKEDLSYADDIFRPEDWSGILSGLEPNKISYW